MDPITIGTAVVGLLKATYQVSTVLKELTKGIKGAPQSAQNALAETQAITSILRQLQAYLDGDCMASSSRAALVSLEEIVVTLTACVCAVSELETILNKLNITEMGSFDRMKWMWYSDDVVKITTRIQTQKASLTLMFNILTCEHQRDAAQSSSKLADLLEKTYAQNKELAERMKNLEYARSSADTARQDSETGTVFEVQKPLKEDEEDTGISFAPVPDFSDKLQISGTEGLSAFTSEVETSLQGSRVYRRAHRSHIRSSMILDGQTLGFSLVSDISLSEISNISVIGLPLSIADLSNGQYYQLEDPATETDIAVKRVQIGAVKTVGESATSQESMNKIKLVVVGQNGRLKTKLLLTYTIGRSPSEYLPTVFDNYKVTIMCDGLPYELALHDTAGQENYDRLRPLSYPQTDVFIVCAQIGNRSEFEAARDKWAPEVKYHAPGVPLLLLGVRNVKRLDYYAELFAEPLMQHPALGEWTTYGETIAKEIGAVTYLECDIDTMQGVKNVFDEAIKTVLQPVTRKATSRWRRTRLRPVTEMNENPD